MSIPVTCPQCGAIRKVNESLAGRRVRCPECDTAVHVPEMDQPGVTEMHSPDGHESPASILPGSIDPDEFGDSEPEAVVVAAEAVPVQPAEVTGHTGGPIDPHDNEDAHPVTPQAIAEADLDEDDHEEVFKRTPRDEEELDMTPMVDVTFLLLIFFMVTAAFSLQKSIQMPRQQTDAPSTTVVDQEEEDLTPIELQVDEYGSFLVLAADWQEETPGKQNLITTLKRANTGGPMRLVIKVHEMCKLQFLVDAMDAGTIAGFNETQVTQVEEFD